MLGFESIRRRAGACVLIVTIMSCMPILPVMAKDVWSHKAESQDLSATEALNEQQLQALSAPDVPRDSGAVNAPRSLTTAIQQDQPVGWTLISGELVGKQLAQWGQMAGWRVIWSYKQDWIVPSAAVFQGDFASAVTQVLEDMAVEGAPVHGVFYQGNHTLVIMGGGQ